jgi:riboflavin kinase/FMN adenylyltransferase
VRPNLKQPKPMKRLEVHLLDFHQDVYGQQLEVTFLRKLRDEQRFANLEELRAQIGRDIESARKVF